MEILYKTEVIFHPYPNPPPQGGGENEELTLLFMLEPLPKGRSLSGKEVYACMLKEIQSFCSTYIFSTRDRETRDVENSRETHNLEVATCAILLEIANIDGEFTDQEREIIFGILKEKFSLTESAAHELMELTKQELSDSVDIWQFTNSINKEFSHEEKINLIETIWKVIYADSRMDKHENYFIHKLQKLLRISHKELIDAKLRVKNTL